MAYTYTTSIVPSGWQGSTYLNPSVRTYTDLTTRIKIQLGFPVMQVEALDCMIYDNISIAIEKYSRYAGFTEEYFVFDSEKYVRGMGIKMDEIISSIGMTFRTETSEVSGRFYDYELEDYRKVSNLFTFDPVQYSGTDALFTLDYVFASQVYFNYMQNFGGFDLVTWQTLKEWMELRQKMFATQPHFMFDNRTQRLRLSPEPSKAGQRYLGVVGAYVEKPIRDMLPELWVQRYSLALTKLMVGNIRGKFGTVNLLGGGSLNYNDVLAQGLEEKKTLEADLMDKPGEAPPLGFFVG